MTTAELRQDASTDWSDLPAIGTLSPARQAFLGLWVTFTAAPILFGLDKFAGILHSDWPVYLAPWINDIIPGTAMQAMWMIGIVEIVAGVLVLVAPRIGAVVVALWLFGIIVNLLTLGNFYDIALRDFGLMMAAIALQRLATAYHHRDAEPVTRS